MPTPRLLMDNDALLKAAHWDLLDVVPTMVGGTWADTACLPTLPPRVHRAGVEKNRVGYGNLWTHLDGFSESILRWIAASEAEQESARW